MLDIMGKGEGNADEGRIGVRLNHDHEKLNTKSTDIFYDFLLMIIKLTWFYILLELLTFFQIQCYLNDTMLNWPNRWLSMYPCISNFSQEFQDKGHTFFV